MSRKASRHIKLQKETIELLEATSKQVDERCRMLAQFVASFPARTTKAVKQDIRENCDENLGRSEMLLIDYIEQINKRPKLEKSEKNYAKEEKKSLTDEPKSIKMEDESMKEKIKNNAVPVEPNIPEIIKPKKIGYRKARPDELLFSARGTPISIETPRTLIKNLQSTSYKAASKKELDYDNPLGSDISEVD